MDEIKFRFDELNKLIEICKKLKDVDIPTTTSRTYCGARLFNKIVLHSISFNKLWPKRVEPDSIENLDAGALASIARIIIDTHNVFHYLCEPGISKDEFEFRNNRMGLHHSCSILDILSKWGFTESDSIVSSFLVSKKVGISLLNENSVFLSSDPQTRENILTGKRAFKIGYNNDFESGLFNLFSNSIHSYSLGIENNFGWQLNNHVGRINMLFLAHETVIIYLSSVTKSYVSLRRKISSYISKDEKEFINNIDDKYLQNWIEKRKLTGYENI